MATNINSNKELLVHICDYHNPIAQAMIIQAVESLTKQIIEAYTPEFIKEQNEKNGAWQLVSPELWLKTAKEIKEELDKFYKK